jgi:hypothetical protein
MKQYNTITLEEFLQVIGNQSPVNDIKDMLNYTRWSTQDPNEIILVNPILLLLWFYRSNFDSTEEPSEELYNKFNDIYVIVETSLSNEKEEV